MELSKALKKFNSISLLVAALLVVIFSACSTKEVFEPPVVQDDWAHYNSSDFLITDTSSNVAQLEDTRVLTDTGIVDIDINTTYRLISLSDDWVISASIDGNVSLVSVKDTSTVKTLDLKKSIAGASVEGNELAVLFTDNEIALYDIDSGNILFKEQGSKAIANDSRIVNPYFMRGLVLFGTLDGKVIFVDLAKKKRLRTVIVSSEENFNNVISLNVVDNKIIAATSYKILSIAKKEVRVKYEIRNIVYDDNMIYIATKQGNIISLTPDLQVVSKIKFPFAHFYGMLSDGDKLYILEKEGYMIVVDKKTFDYTIHEVDFDSEGFIFTGDKKFFIDDMTISVE